MLTSWKGLYRNISKLKCRKIYIIEMAWISVVVLYLSSRLVLWMRFLYLDLNKLYGFPEDLDILDRFPEKHRAVTIKNIVMYYFPFVDLCVVMFIQYDTLFEDSSKSFCMSKFMTYIIFLYMSPWTSWFYIFFISPNVSFGAFWIRGLLRIPSNIRALG